VAVVAVVPEFRQESIVVRAVLVVPVVMARLVLELMAREGVVVAVEEVAAALVEHDAPFLRSEAVQHA